MSETIKESRSKSKERKETRYPEEEVSMSQVGEQNDCTRTRSDSPAKRKKQIPKALREQVWIKHIGKHYNAKCTVGWCTNFISVFDFQSGHIIPESKGGPMTLENLMPICSRCNSSMNNQYTITEWNTLGSSNLSFYKRVSANIRLCLKLFKC
jgi:5-methylcytosine-specific restriction endonuclease McrA